MWPFHFSGNLCVFRVNKLSKKVQKIKISIRDWWRDEAALGCVTMDNVGKGSTPLIHIAGEITERTQVLIIANRNKAHQGNCLVKEKKI